MVQQGIFGLGVERIRFSVQDFKIACADQVALLLPQLDPQHVFNESRPRVFVASQAIDALQDLP